MQLLHKIHDMDCWVKDKTVTIITTLRGEIKVEQEQERGAHFATASPAPLPAQIRIPPHR